MLGLFTNRAQVLRAALASDGFGGDQATWQTAISDYPCRLYLKAGRVIRGERGEEEAHSIQLIGPVADVRAGDRVVVSGRTYLVASVEVKEGRRASHHIEAQLKAI